MKRVVVYGSAALLLATATTGWAAGDAAAGKAKYDMFCTSCHGMTGKGDGPAGASLNPKPRNFTDQAWQKATDDATIAKVVKLGGPSIGKSPLMTAWGSALSDGDIANVVAYVRQLGAAK